MRNAVAASLLLACSAGAVGAAPAPTSQLVDVLFIEEQG
jgi:hypothetical protein